MDFLLAATIPTELSTLTTNSFQNNTRLLNMPPTCFDFIDFIVYKQANVNIAIRSWDGFYIVLVTLRKTKCLNFSFLIIIRFIKHVLKTNNLIGLVLCDDALHLLSQVSELKGLSCS